MTVVAEPVLNAKTAPTEAELRSGANAEVFADCLKQYLKRRFDCKRPAVRFGLPRYLVVARRKQFDLYFRVTPPKGDLWRSDTLVVARIGFDQERKGHGTDLLRFLVGIAEAVGFTHIGIESANGDCSAFAARLGLTPYGRPDNFLASVADISERLP